MCTKALLGDPLPMTEGQAPPCTSAINTIKNVIRVHKKYWDNLIFQVSLPKENILPKIKGYGVDNKLDIKREISRKISESKIALEDIVSEKLEISLKIDEKIIGTVNNEEIDKLGSEIENMKIGNIDDDTILNKKNNGKKIDDFLSFFLSDNLRAVYKHLPFVFFFQIHSIPV